MVESCSIGLQLDEACHGYLSRSHGLAAAAALSADDKELVEWRSGSDLSSEGATICNHHLNFYLSKYENMQKWCMDPGGRHKTRVKKALRSIDAELAAKLKLKPGQKLCVNCMKRAADGEFMISSSSASDDNGGVAGGSFTQPETPVAREDLKRTLSTLGISPFQTHGLHQEAAATYAKQKADRIRDVATEHLSKVVHVDPQTLKDCDSCQEYFSMIELLKVKCQQSTRQEKMRILTLLPDGWTIERTMIEFSVSKRLVDQARELRKSGGILADPPTKRGHPLPVQVTTAVRQFYESGEFSRIFPGKKDFISTKIDGEKTQKQKVLLLANLDEMYISFKAKHSDMKIGISKFCELRPKWCLTVDSPGSKSVCVCEIHQNVKLILAALPTHIDYKGLLAKLVCSVENRRCMLRICRKCPGISAVEKFLKELLDDEDVDSDDVMNFKQWMEPSGKTELVNVNLRAEDYIHKVCDLLDKLRSHQFIAKSQAAYLQELKPKLGIGECIILGDFAENYSFVVQDSVQGFYWMNTQATLHPFVVYTERDSDVECGSFCVVSDNLKHDTNAVHTFIKYLTDYLKTEHTDLKHIIYFSDGASAQYKNYKNLYNLLHHKTDFGVTAEWHFFATSHGKSPCDGIGGTVKRLVARASLQAALAGHIDTPQKMYDWARKNIEGIKFFYVPTESITAHSELLKLEERYQQLRTIAGTRSHHCYRVEEEKLVMYRVSCDSKQPEKRKPAGRRSKKPLDVASIGIGKYVACLYDDWCSIGVVTEKSNENKDLLVKLLKHVKDFEFTWPLRVDSCYIPFQDVICTVRSWVGRKDTYNLSKRDYEKIIEELECEVSFD